jgi:hypothetical protein
MPHLLEEILSYLEVPDKLRLAIAIDDVRQMIQDNRLFRSLTYNVPLLRRSYVDRQGFLHGAEQCRGSLVFVEARHKYEAMLQLLLDDVSGDPWLDDNLQVSFVLANSREEATDVSVFLTANNLTNFVSNGPLSPTSTFRIRDHHGLYVIIFYKFVGSFRLHPKVRVISLHVPGNTETFRQILRVGAVTNDCIVDVENYEQLIRANKIAKYLSYKRLSSNDVRTVVPAERFVIAHVL